MKIKEITTEYMTDPVGLDVNPRFSWKMESSRENVMQKAYRICVYRAERPAVSPERYGADSRTDNLTAPVQLLAGKQVWDSGRQESERSLFIPYDGETLEPFRKYTVHISI